MKPPTVTEKSRATAHPQRATPPTPPVKAGPGCAGATPPGPSER